VIRANSSIAESSSKDWLDSAEVKSEKRKKHKNFGLVDAMLLIKQKQLNAIILTGDKHFKENRNVEMI